MRLYLSVFISGFSLGMLYCSAEYLYLLFDDANRIVVCMHNVFCSEEGVP